ncbi:MAG: hydroxymethylbilane synthase, partial [Pyrinomonadaceae bacterium]|nr:hydroxymethylbilane synthase [Pyrinomonadaceae bacterium]
EDARDALVLRADWLVNGSSSGASLQALPEGASIGTSSLRRLAQLKHLRPDFNIRELRGNVDTRLRKLDTGDYDAIVLAAAGLNRLGFAHRISAVIESKDMLSAIGQGALGIETRAQDHAVNNIVARLDDTPTRLACTAERALLRALGGGCQLPIAGHAVVHEGRLRLEGLVAAPTGERIVRDSLEGPAAEAARIGEDLAARLHGAGAATLLAEIAI